MDLCHTDVIFPSSKEIIYHTLGKKKEKKEKQTVHDG